MEYAWFQSTYFGTPLPQQRKLAAEEKKICVFVVYAHAGDFSFL